MQRQKVAVHYDCDSPSNSALRRLFSSFRLFLSVLDSGVSGTAMLPSLTGEF